MNSDKLNGSVYYRDSGRVPLASRVSLIARRRIFERFMTVMQPTPETRLLDIGATGDTTFRESNFFEQFYPYPERITCVGTENASHLEERYRGLKFVPVQPGEPLPFSNGEFDIVFSNAVVEHTGGLAGQRAFLLEACRVARRVFITTPNRWFPVETHTGVPLLHYLPKRMYRRILGRTALGYWSHEENLNLLTSREFVTLFPGNYPVAIKRIGVGISVFQSNLVAYTISRGD
jgi:hypothetical protein